MTDIMDNTCTCTPLVSVIVPVYNAAQTLERCVEGILAQSFSDFELILVDDGSTDASGAICAAYSDADSRVVVVSQPNKGVSAARNAGLDRARGRYVAFCDSDDTVKDYWLSSMVAVAEKAGMIVCGYNILRPGEHEWTQETLGHTEIFTDDDVLLETLLGKRLFQFIWNKLFKMSLIRESGLRFDESFTIFEDEYFVLGSFQSVVERIYEIVKDVPGRLHLPSVVYWYKVALGRYVSSHTYRQSAGYLQFAKRLADTFNDGPMSHLSVRILPPRLLYWLLRAKSI